MYFKYKNYLSLVIWISTITFIGLIIGFLTKNSVNTWYITLNRSTLTPPNYLFGIAWSILYILIGISGSIVWNQKPRTELNLIKNLYVIQLVLNWSWTPLFFIYHLTGFSLICLFLLIGFVSLFILKSFNKIRISALLFIPYLLWLIFAFYLNFYIWCYN